MDSTRKKLLLRHQSSEDSGPCKRHEPMSSLCSGTEASYVNLVEARQLLTSHLANKLPECDTILPWLHGYSNESPPATTDLVVIRSCNCDTHTVTVLSKLSLCMEDVLFTFKEYYGHSQGSTDQYIADIKSMLIQDGILPPVAQRISDFCGKYRILPFLKSDIRIKNKLLHKTRAKVGDPFCTKVTWKEASSLRRFDIQAAKSLEMSSNILVYCLHHSKNSNCELCIEVTSILRHAVDSIQSHYQNLHHTILHNISILKYGTIKELTKSFSTFASNLQRYDPISTEKTELTKFSTATPIDPMKQIWCGNTTDCKNQAPDIQKPWTLFIQCSNNVVMPNLEELFDIFEFKTTPIKLVFPSSGSIPLGSLNVKIVSSIINTCYVMYHFVAAHTNNIILIYCSDGYTETSFLLVAFVIFLLDISLETALLELHEVRKRPFYLFHVDLQVLGHLQSLLREYSPKRHNKYSLKMDSKPVPLNITGEMFSRMFFIRVPQASDFSKLNGPLPSKILPHLYLGSLEHAQATNLLKEMGINNILSVGENIKWLTNNRPTLRHRGISSPPSFHPGFLRDELHSRRATLSSNTNMYSENLKATFDILQHEGFQIFRINNLADNGRDVLTHQLENALRFIDEVRQRGERVLVHCMVGVSRSATICIAECMRRLDLDLFMAYIFVRIRRLNIIIQPNLTFMYELLKWEEETGGRSTDWNMLCKSISDLNSNYL